MIKNIDSKSRIKLHWKVSPYDFTKEKANSLILKLSKKYNIQKDRISIIPEFITIDSNGDNISVTSDIIDNIQDSKFQLKLMEEYITINNIDGYDFNIIKKIDSEINSKIDYTQYKNYNKYSINWIRWSNFLSYGEDNYFNFKQLGNLVLLNGEPANQSGKTTFAIDLIHFLLFGKTDKSSTLDKIFNKHLQDATKVIVEGSITINNEEYIIKRELTRQSAEKRNVKNKASQKVLYYKKVGNDLEELKDSIEDLQGESSVETNKIIKESIGTEDDFDMIICATSSTLDELIDLKDSERGRLLSRWIGLIPIEEKEAISRKKFNEDVKPYLISNRYNTEQLNQEISTRKLNSKELKSEISKYTKEINSIEKEVEELESTKKNLISAKISIDNSVLKLDIQTLNASMKDISFQGKNKAERFKTLSSMIDEIESIEYNPNELDMLNSKSAELNGDIKLLKQKYLTCEDTIKKLKSSEYCPTCGRKYDGIDNTVKIKELEDEKAKLADEGKLLNIQYKNILKDIESMRNTRDKYNLKLKYSTEKSSLEVSIEKLRNEFKEKQQLLKEYNKNHEAIDKNNNLDIEINKIESNIKLKRNTRDTDIRLIEQHTSRISILDKEIEEKKILIKDIANEENILRHWKLYLEMVGRNGIPKMVLRKALPLINAQITNLLFDVCDFTVEVAISDKNEIMFYLIKDGVKSDLSSGSGFERTASALALRTVLGNISTLPKMNSLVLDEIFSRVAKENYENMKNLLNKMLANYDYIIVISHLDEIKDLCDKIITVTKKDNVSRISIIK